MREPSDKLFNLPPLSFRRGAHPRRIGDGARDDLADMAHAAATGFGTLDVEPAALEGDVPVKRTAGTKGRTNA